MKILKFGGTSVGKTENFNKVIEILSTGGKKIVVLSAFTGTTDFLIRISEFIKSREFNLAKEAIDEFEAKNKVYVDGLFDRREYKHKAKEILASYSDLLRRALKEPFSGETAKTIISYGEMISTKILHLSLQEKGISSIWINALNFMKKNEKEMPDYKFIKTQMESILVNCENEDIIITQGYICRDSKGEIDNFERGGSDYSATIIAAAVQATEVQIWTDVDGLQNNDPRCVNRTFTISEISYKSAIKLACFGAKILHPLCIYPVMKMEIPVLLKNTQRPEAKGTLIHRNPKQSEHKAIAAKDRIVVVNLKNKHEYRNTNFKETITAILMQHQVKPLLVKGKSNELRIIMERDNLCESLIWSLEEEASMVIQRFQTIVCITGLKGISRNEVGILVNRLGEIPLKWTHLREKANHLLMVFDSEYKQEILNRLNTLLFTMEDEMILKTMAA